MKFVVAPSLILLTLFSSETRSDDDAPRALFASRGLMERRALLEAGGGNEASEDAVAQGLKWIANHQLPDGGWSFDHRIGGDCRGRCSHQGSAAEARNAATAMALLAFLGAGHTHQDGAYKKKIRAGLDHLVLKMKPAGGGGSLHEPQGSMYAHGLGAIALCEAYAMTKDKALKMPAQAAIDFIVSAQDPVGGGWRYSPRQPGDTSVFGWQLSALKSAHAAGLKVPAATITNAKKFLATVAAEGGAFYGYTTPGKGRATSAIGLLSQMYFGCEHDDPALAKGVAWLGESGPSVVMGRGNLYYNYYANQVMFHYGGKAWDKWNEKMRDELVKSQKQDGHPAGSWQMAGDHGSERGGRLYCTALAVLILETYYRHARLYKDEDDAE